MTTPPTDRDLLAFESRWFRYPGAKHTAIRDELGVSATAYWQSINRILDGPDPSLAVEFGPLLNRLRRARDAGQRMRRAS